MKIKFFGTDVPSGKTVYFYLEAEKINDVFHRMARYEETMRTPFWIYFIEVIVNISVVKE